MVFIAASIVVPIIANGLRALGIVALGHVLGSAQAAATDHVLYGWMFFSLVILLLIALGLPFREDIGPYRGAGRRGRSGVQAGRWRPLARGCDRRRPGAVVLAAVSPALAMQLDRAGRPQSAAPSRR